MDNEQAIGGPAKATLPKGKSFAPNIADTVRSAVVAAPHPVPGSVATVSAADSDKTGVFGQLVKDDGDIVGLVAYSVYKQNKLDWLRAFEVAKSRVPNDEELSSYIIGEGTPRRLATYRHLAEATLAGNGPDVEGSGQAKVGFKRFGSAERAGLAPAVIASYALIAVLFILLFWVAFRFTMSSH